MPIPGKYVADFEEGGIYHVYNRTNNKEKLFLTEDNRKFFLKRYKEIVAPFADTYCWCLLPNHFHLLIKVKSENEILTFLQSKPQTELTVTEKKFLQRVANLSNSEQRVANLSNSEPRVANLSKPEQRVANLSKVGNPGANLDFSQLIEQTFKRFFQSYALAFNKQHNRKGNLFYKPFKRICIDKDSQFTMAIIYIHANAAKHKLVKDFSLYPWSSWHTIMSNQSTLLLRNEVIQWFGGLNEFVKVHKEMAEYYYNCDVAIDD